MFYVIGPSVLPNVTDELGDDDVPDVRQEVVLNKKIAAADGGNRVVKKVRGFLADEASLSTCQTEGLSLFVAAVPYLWGHSCTRASLAKLDQYYPES